MTNNQLYISNNLQNQEGEEEQEEERKKGTCMTSSNSPTIFLNTHMPISFPSILNYKLKINKTQPNPTQLFDK